MSAQNVIGATLERYLDSVPRPHGWHWCCGSFVRAIDFLYKRPDGEWFALQAKKPRQLGKLLRQRNSPGHANPEVVSIALAQRSLEPGEPASDDARQEAE